MTKPNFLTLPMEILDEVGRCLEKGALCALLAVSRRAYDIFVVALYRDMNITFNGSEGSTDALALIETLARNERLVLLIRHLRMDLFLNAKGTTRELLLQISRFFESIPPERSHIQTFLYTPWLEDWAETGEEAIIQDLAAVGPIILASFNRLRLPCLHTLVLNGVLPGLSYMFDTRPFLAAHPGLKTLDVSCQFLVPDAGTIPNLERYTGRPMDIINVCASGSRPIRALKLYLPSSGAILAPDEDGTGESLELILHALGETKTLRELRLVPTWPEGSLFEVTGRGQGCMPPSLLKTIVGAAPGLESVELYVGDMLVETLCVLRQLDKLHEVHLHCQREITEASSTPGSAQWRSQKSFDDLKDEDVFPLLSTATPIQEILLPYCPLLRTVCVEWRGWRKYSDGPVAHTELQTPVEEVVGADAPDFGPEEEDGAEDEEEEEDEPPDEELADWDQTWKLDVREVEGKRVLQLAR